MNYTDEDVERVAVGICQADGQDWLILGETYNGRQRKTDYRRFARAALSAMPRHVPDRNAIIEECAKVAEAQAQEFLSPEYATGQPLSSFQERFACGQVASAIRALAAAPPAPLSEASDKPVNTQLEK